ncbi:hypothetical protein ACHAXA_002704 [Cyclostephanos tholiformis]|uniref:Uncharacterized protein n=1 Tax=Cyclostephanos tholiformis TaxID=382380 RepID=A0ABD3R828_9STRA
MGCSQSKAANASADAPPPTNSKHEASGSPSQTSKKSLNSSPSPTSKNSLQSKSSQPAALYYHLLCGLNPISPNEKTIGAVTESFWEGARQLCSSNPALASYVDPNTLGTPLHVACSLGSSQVDSSNLSAVAMACIQTIIDSCPGAVSHRDKRRHIPLDGIISSMQATDGVMSASFSFRIKVAKLLLEHDSRSIVSLGKVLYQVIESLPDDIDTPLGPTVEFVKLLVTRGGAGAGSAGAGSTVDENSRISLLSEKMDDDVLALLYRRFVRQFDQSERFFEGDNSRDEVVQHREIFKNAAVNTFNIIEILMRRQNTAEPYDDDLLVHNAVRTGSCPPDLLRYIVETNLEMVAEPDSKGNLPLHYAAGHADFCYLSTAQAPESYSKYVIDELLYAYPEGASVANADGALPITLAVESGKKWIGGGIRSLHEAYPPGIEQISLGEDHPLVNAMSFQSQDEESVDQSILEGLEGQVGREGSIATGVDGGGGRSRKRKQRKRINKDESHDAIMLVQRPEAKIRDVVSTMWANEEDGGVQMLGCSALELAATAAGPSNVQIASVALLGVTAVVNAMKNHPNEPAVQEKACSALAAMALADGEREVSFAASGAISSVVSAMQAHVSDATVQKEACRALQGIAAKGGAERATVIASVSGFTALVNALAAHPQDRSVQREACKALEVLTSFRDAYLPELHEQTEMLIQSAAKNFPNDCLESKNAILLNLMRMRSVE